MVRACAGRSGKRPFSHVLLSVRCAWRSRHQSGARMDRSIHSRGSAYHRCRKSRRLRRRIQYPLRFLFDSLPGMDLAQRPKVSWRLKQNCRTTRQNHSRQASVVHRNVGQANMTTETKIALLMFHSGVLGTIVGGYFAVTNAPEISTGLKSVLRFAGVLLVIGSVLCWRGGWKRYNEEFFGKGFARFLVCVWLAPFSLPFSIQ